MFNLNSTYTGKISLVSNDYTLVIDSEEIDTINIESITNTSGYSFGSLILIGGGTPSKGHGYGSGRN